MDNPVCGLCFCVVQQNLLFRDHTVNQHFCSSPLNVVFNITQGVCFKAAAVLKIL